MINVLIVQELLKAGDQYLRSKKSLTEEEGSRFLKQLNEKGMAGVFEK